MVLDCQVKSDLVIDMPTAGNGEMMDAVVEVFELEN
jgi:hypothetical protein